MHAVGAVVSPLCTLQPSLRDAGEGAVGGRVCRTGGGRALGAAPGTGTAHLGGAGSSLPLSEPALTTFLLPYFGGHPISLGEGRKEHIL